MNDPPSVEVKERSAGFGELRPRGVSSLLRYQQLGRWSSPYNHPEGLMTPNHFGCNCRNGWEFFLEKHDGQIISNRAIVLKARETGLAGATVVRGVMGFGKHSVLHTAKILRLSEDLPMLVEIADSLEKIEQFLPMLDQMITDGLVTLERVRVIQYKA
jgi:PII-like signaling protein